MKLITGHSFTWIACAALAFAGCSEESKPSQKTAIQKLRSGNESEQRDGAQQAKENWGAKKEGDHQ